MDDVDMDVVMTDEKEKDGFTDIPYAPSFVVDLTRDVDETIKNLTDFVFIPGLNNPTVAVLYQTQLTWTGRLKEHKDTHHLTLFTLDLNTRSYPIISNTSSLPYDALYMLPCSPSLGGVVIIASNSIIYVDISGRRVALAVSGWAARTSDATTFIPAGPEVDLHLEGSKAAFVDDRTLSVVCKDGTAWIIEIGVDGRTVARLSLGKDPVARVTIPSVAATLPLGDTTSEANESGEQYIFVGSTSGPSVLLGVKQVEEEILEESGDALMDDQAPALPPAPVVQEIMDLDDDDDIYGAKPALAETSGEANGVSAPKKNTKTVTQLYMCDSLPAHGNVSSMAFSLAKNGERLVPELVAATGTGHLGGFTLFQRDLPVQVKRKLHAIGGARGVWSLPVRTPFKSNTSHGQHGEYESDTVIVSTDANPSPGLSRISNRSAQNDINITNRIPGTTIGCGAFFKGTAILHVMTNSIRVLEPDGTERQVIKDLDGNTPRPKIRSCSICDPFVLIFREDNSIGLFVDAERGRIRRKDMSPMGDKTSKYLSGCFYSDTTGIFEVGPKPGTAEATEKAAAAPGNSVPTQWLLLVRPPGILEIWSLPKLTISFSAPLLNNLESVVYDSHDVAALSLPQDPPRMPEVHDVDQILLAPMGEDRLVPHLFVLLRSGQLVIYEAVPCSATPESNLNPNAGPRATGLHTIFVKILTKTYKIQRPDESTEKSASVLAEQKRISRVLIPFVTFPTRTLNGVHGNTQGGTLLPVAVPYHGVFFTGDNPTWFIRTNKGGTRVYPSGHNVVHAFTTCSLWDSRNDFLMYTDEGPCLLEWLPNLQMHGPLPSRSVPRERAYSHLFFDTSTSLIVAVSMLQARFASYNEDSVQMWEPDAPNVADPTCDCSTLELVSRDVWLTMDGFEFANNEYVCALESVTLETASTEAGYKDFIAVGTTIDRGEDLAVKGATYIFEIVEVVPSAPWPQRWYKLRLRCRDDAKGPVTALAAFSGYLVSSMGQKIFVRAMDSDERLVGVAFLDIGVYVTCLRTVKNLLLIGDAVKGVWLVAFQEDPYKLVVLGKDPKQVCVSAADYLFSGDGLSLVSCDEDGVIRLYDYDPSDPESKGGHYLSLRTEFHSHSEYRSSVMIARRTKDEPILPQAKLICGGIDGSIASLTPVSETSAKRMQLLQGHLVRNVQHVAALNPKALRVVPNETVSKPLLRGMFDGNLVMNFTELPVPKQQQMSKQIGSDKEDILQDWMSLSDVW
jgi:cleavage and polyadenylation specificity factor subunit 1